MRCSASAGLSHVSLCLCTSTRRQYLSLCLALRLHCLAFDARFLAILLPRHISPRISPPTALGSPKAARPKVRAQPRGRRSRPKHQPCGIRSRCLGTTRSFVRLSLIFLLEQLLSFCFYISVSLIRRHSLRYRTSPCRSVASKTDPFLLSFSLVFYSLIVAYLFQSPRPNRIKPRAPAPLKSRQLWPETPLLSSVCVPGD